MLPKVIIYTDGSCSGNPGPGGWGAVLISGENKKTIAGGSKSTTNNRMELTAVIEALSALKCPCEIELHSDSQYFINTMTKGWIESWQKKGWVKSDKKPVLNRDLWERIIEETSKHDMTYVWVRGHNGDEYNELCDFLATEQTKKYSE